MTSGRNSEWTRPWSESQIVEMFKKAMVRHALPVAIRPS